MLKPVRTAPDLVTRVYAQLRDAIVAGDIAPGQRLAQEDLAAQLGVSRQPVLRALALLERDGLAVRADGRGTLQAAALDPATIQEFYELRAEVDALAARLAAQRIAAGQAAPLPESPLARARPSSARRSTSSSPASPSRPTTCTTPTRSCWWCCGAGRRCAARACPS